MADSAGAPNEDGLQTALDRLAAAPEDESLIEPFVSELEGVESERRNDAVQRASAALSGHLDALIALGDGLYGESFPDCELLGARVYLDALQTDAAATGAIDGIASALHYIDALEDAEAVFEEAARLTNRDVRLVQAWARWLGAHGQDDRRRGMLEELLAGATAQLEATPDDTGPIPTLASALSDAAPDVRTQVLERLSRTLSGHTEALVALGRALYQQSFPDCELLGARVYLDALRTDATATGAIDGIASALHYIDTLEDAEAVFEEAARLTNRDVRLVQAWARWLGAHGQDDRRRGMCEELLAGATAQLEATPDDTGPIPTLASALSDAAPDVRTQVLERLSRTLSGHTEALVALGRALYQQSFPDCELLGARVYLDALRTDATATGAIDGIASALHYIDTLEDAEAVFEEAARLTNRDVRLVQAWARWLGAHGRDDRQLDVLEELLAGATAQLEATPDDPGAIASLVSAIENANPQTRPEVLERVKTMVSQRAAALAALGNALWRRNFAGCELMGARVLIEALQADPAAPEAIDGIASAVAYVTDPDDAQSVIEQALRLTSGDQRLVSAWNRWMDRVDTGAVLPRGSTYGTCRCSGTFEQQSVEIRLAPPGEIVLADMPEGVCPSCGAKIYKSSVLAAIEAAFHARGPVHAPPQA